MSWFMDRYNFERRAIMYFHKWNWFSADSHWLQCWEVVTVSLSPCHQVGPCHLWHCCSWSSLRQRYWEGASGRHCRSRNPQESGKLRKQRKGLYVFLMVQYIDAVDVLTQLSSPSSYVKNSILLFSLHSISLQYFITVSNSIFLH